MIRPSTLTPELADDLVDAAGGKQHRERRNQHDEGGGDARQVLAQQEMRAVIEEHGTEHGTGARDRRDGQRIDGDPADMLDRFDLGNFGLGLRLAENHGQRKEEEDHAAGDLERRKRDAERLQEDLAADDEEDEDDGGYEYRADGDLGAVLGEIATGRRQEDRYRPDGVDQHPHHDELAEQVVDICHAGEVEHRTYESLPSGKLALASAKLQSIGYRQIPTEQRQARQGTGRANWLDRCVSIHLL